MNVFGQFQAFACCIAVWLRSCDEYLIMTHFVYNTLVLYTTKPPNGSHKDVSSGSASFLLSSTLSHHRLFSSNALIIFMVGRFFILLIRIKVVCNSGNIWCTSARSLTRACGAQRLVCIIYLFFPISSLQYKQSEIFRFTVYFQRTRERREPENWSRYPIEASL